MSVLIANFMKWFGELLGWDAPQAPISPQKPQTADVLSPAPTAPQTPVSCLTTLYQEAVSNLGKHLTLNPSVNPEVGCAEAVSFILLNAGYSIPANGIPTVWGLIDWMLANGFTETKSPVPGCVITACRADRHPTEYAHIGIVLKHGIASNDSRLQYLGKFLENYSSISNWELSFEQHGSETRFFICG